MKLEHITKDTELAKVYFMHKVAFTMGPVELKTAIDNKDDIQIIDTRSAEKYVEGHVPGAISIPGENVREKLHELSKKKISIVYCYSQQCHLAAKAAIKFAEHGYPVVEMEGGFQAWKDAQFPIE